MATKKINLMGQRFGRLTVVEQNLAAKNGSYTWICKCDCGNITKPIRGDCLRNGHRKSCGCIKKEVCGKFTTHGKSESQPYTTWTMMKQRCFNPHACGFQNYGGRGITVCDEWKDNFQAFYDYVSKLPHFGEVGYSLDRINNDGNYEPGNVRWATRYEQQNNRRKKNERTRRIETVGNTD